MCTLKYWCKKLNCASLLFFTGNLFYSLILFNSTAVTKHLKEYWEHILSIKSDPFFVVPATLRVELVALWLTGQIMLAVLSLPFCLSLLTVNRHQIHCSECTAAETPGLICFIFLGFVETQAAVVRENILKSPGIKVTDTTGGKAAKKPFCITFRLNPLKSFHLKHLHFSPKSERRKRFFLSHSVFWAEKYF